MTIEGTTRRDLLRRGALIGGATVWAVPAVQALSMAAAHAESTSGTPPVDNPPVDNPPVDNPPVDNPPPVNPPTGGGGHPACLGPVPVGRGHFFRFPSFRAQRGISARRRLHRREIPRCARNDE